MTYGNFLDGVTQHFENMPYMDPVGCGDPGKSIGFEALREKTLICSPRQNVKRYFSYPSPIEWKREQQILQIQTGKGC